MHDPGNELETSVKLTVRSATLTPYFSLFLIPALVASGQDDQVDHNSNKSADMTADDSSTPDQDVSSAVGVDVKPDVDLMSKPQVMKCEACQAQFHSLDQFMDHRNLDCCQEAGEVVGRCGSVGML